MLKAQGELSKWEKSQAMKSWEEWLKIYILICCVVLFITCSKLTDRYQFCFPLALVKTFSLYPSKTSGTRVTFLLHNLTLRFRTLMKFERLWEHIAFCLKFCSEFLEFFILSTVSWMAGKNSEKIFFPDFYMSRLPLNWPTLLAKTNTSCFPLLYTVAPSLP